MNMRIKSIFIILSFSVIFLCLFSCKSTPKEEDASPDLSQIEEPVEELEDADDVLSESELAESEDDSTGQQDAAEPLTTEAVSQPSPQEIAQGPVEREPVNDAADADTSVGPLEVTAVTEPPLERRPPPVPPPALLGPAEERRPPSRTAPSTQTPSSSTAQTPPSSSSQTPSTLTPPSSIVQTPPAQMPPSQTSPSSGTEDSSSRVDSQSSSPTVSAIRDNPPAPVRSGVLLAPDDKIEFSRVVRATVGQIIEIPFRGFGWVFLGELKSQRGIEYVPPTRRDNEGQTFIFRVEEVGSYALKFYRQDFLRDYILNDYVQVIVDDDPISGTARYNSPIERGKVTALPRWPSALDEASIIRGGSGSKTTTPDTSAAQNDGAQEQGSTEPLAYVEPAPRPVRGTNTQPPVQGDAAPSRPSSAQPSTSAPPASAPAQTTATPTLSPQGSAAQSAAPGAEQPTTAAQSEERLPLDDALQKAKEMFDGGNIAAAIAMLDKYREYYPSGSDELYWLLGQFYEAAGPSRDILLSLDYYRRLVSEYPQSRRYNDARRRIAYLERYYINIQ